MEPQQACIGHLLRRGKEEVFRQTLHGRQSPETGNGHFAGQRVFHGFRFDRISAYGIRIFRQGKRCGTKRGYDGERGRVHSRKRYQGAGQPAVSGQGEGHKSIGASTLRRA